MLRTLDPPAGGEHPGRVADASAAQRPVAGGDGFIRWRAGTLQGASHAPALILARFQPQAYTSGLFAHYGIDMPGPIRNSVARRQAEFLAGRLCARLALDAQGWRGGGVTVGSHRQPVWPAGWTGSITHSGCHAAAAAGPQADLLGIGIDIEHAVSGEASQALGERVVSGRERAGLQDAVRILGIDRLLTLVFSAKESFFKAAFTQVGDYFDFDAVEVTRIDTSRRTIDMRCTRTLCPLLQSGLRCRARFEYLDGGAVLTWILLDGESVWHDAAATLPEL